ncbi:hypothetical protein C0U44_08970 [Klebsiella pneumoniae]|nr:hypothetical protein CKQ87_22815 [Klebsiella pneumoniae]PLC30598.1 hypothetical protein C0U44_08970 [Klebsiella pneumoniae]
MKAAPGLGYRSLREEAVGRISVAPSGTKAGMAPEVSCPAALRLPGRGVGFRGAFREKTPTALKQEGR